MPSTEKTGYLNLTQYQENDITSWMEDYNSDMRKIDAGVQENHGEIADNKQSILTMQTNITSNTSAIEQINSNIAGNPEKFAQIEAELNNHDTLINGNAQNINKIMLNSLLEGKTKERIEANFRPLNNSPSDIGSYGLNFTLPKGLYVGYFNISWENNYPIIPIYPILSWVETNKGSVLIYSFFGNANFDTTNNKVYIGGSSLFTIQPEGEEEVEARIYPEIFAADNSDNNLEILGNKTIPGNRTLLNNTLIFSRIGE